MMTIQLRRSSFDNDVAWISAENLNFSAQQDLDGYNDVTLKVTAPSAADTTLTFEVNANSNNKLVPLEGLVLADLLVKVNGSAITPSLLTEGTTAGTYTLTTPAFVLADIVTVELFDSVLNATTINLDGVLYKSNLGKAIAV